MNTRGFYCPHPDRPQALPYADSVHVCAECFAERTKTLVQQSWDHQCGPNDTSTDGRSIHYKAPTFEWRKS